jgi:hypothetical protein
MNFSSDNDLEDNEAECKIRRAKTILYTSNIFFGVLMFGSVIGLIVRHGGEISTGDTDMLGIILIITFVTGLLGVVLTNTIWVIKSILLGAKSIVGEAKSIIKDRKS